MDGQELRARQAPIKARYKSDPASALVVLKAGGRVGVEGLTCEVKTGQGDIVTLGLHEAAGGDGLSACTGEMLLEALVGCAGVTLAAVAAAMGIALRGATVSAEGDLDFRGTLNVSKDVPVGIKMIRLKFALDTDADDAQLEKLLRLTERYCVIYETLKVSPMIEVSRVAAKAESGSGSD